jgi:hypothetical protein
MRKNVPIDENLFAEKGIFLARKKRKETKEERKQRSKEKEEKSVI